MTSAKLVLIVTTTLPLRRPAQSITTAKQELNMQTKTHAVLEKKVLRALNLVLIALQLPLKNTFKLKEELSMDSSRMVTTTLTLELNLKSESDLAN